MRAEGPGITGTVRLVEPSSGAFLAVRGLSVEAAVDGPLCRTDLRITFTNDLGRTLEGDLVFPLPPFSALCELQVRVGRRTIVGKVRPRERAQAEYHRAVQAGKTAVLGETEGEDLARLRIAPIEAGEDVEVALSLVHTLLPIADGHRLVLPLTYMPRYVENEQAQKATERAAVERPRPLTLAARAEVKIVVRKGPAPLKVRCTSHSVQAQDEGRVLKIELTGVPLDRDLQLEIADRQPGDLPTTWVRHDPGDGRDGQGPTTAVAVVPPAFAEEGVTVARTILLLVDRSGSMDGDPMRSAIRAVKGCLRALGPADRFNLIGFNDSLQALSRRPLPFDAQSLAAGDAFAEGLSAGGGTEASRALQAVLDDDLGKQARSVQQEGPASDASHRLRIVVFMTDGDVGSAEQVLVRAQDKLIDTRVFVIGIGASVNHAMLTRLAELGSGTYTPVASNEDLERALHKLKSAIDAPILTGVKVRLDVGGDQKEPAKLEPAGRLDLFAGQPLLLAFRGPLPEGAVLQVSAQRSDGEDVTVRVPVRPDPDVLQIDAETAALTWALLKNRRLTYKFDPSDDATLESLGTTFGLLNRKVALVGVHSEQRGTDAPETVPVVLPLPANLAEGGDGGAYTQGVPPPPAPGNVTRAGTVTGMVPGAANFAVAGGSPPPAPAMPARSQARHAARPSASAPVPMAPPPAPDPVRSHFDAMDMDSDDMAVPGFAPPASAPSAITGAPPPEVLAAPDAEEAEASYRTPPPAVPEKKKKGSVLGRIAKALGMDGGPPAQRESAPPPPPAPPAAPPAVSAPPSPRRAAAAAAPAPVAEAAAAGPGAAPHFTSDEAGLRALLLQQGTDGLFGGELGATLLAIAALVGRGHTARSGSFKAELRRTSQALKARLAALAGTDQVLASLALALLWVPEGEAAPGELPAELAAALGGASLRDPPALAATIRTALGKAPAWTRSPLARAIEGAFLTP